MTALQLAPNVTNARPAAAGPRVDDVAAELRGVIRLAGRNPEALEGRLPGLSRFARVTAAGELEPSALTYLILQHLIPEYLDRLPHGPECRAIRELLTWEDRDGALQSLTTRYHKAAAHLVGCASDFGRRQEPRLLRECARRFIALDHEDRLAASASASASARLAGDADAPASSSDPADCVLAEACDPSSGIVGVHRNLDYHRLVDLIAEAQQITILNTWIPGLDILADTLVDALARGSAVSILLLNPASHVAQLRSQALGRSTPGRFQHDRVGPGVRHCLDVLTHISQSVDSDHRHNLRVRLYDTLPSISAYAIDERTFMSFFTHGQLAVKSVQIEILGRTSIMGELVSRELDTLWNMGHECQPALDAA